MSDIGKPVIPLVSSRAVVLATLVFLSGCCALAYEVLYMRALTTLLGDMFYVHAALLSTFLVGIGLGARLARRCVGWLFAFEILTGLYAFGFPVTSRWFSEQPFMNPVSASPALTILFTIMFLCLPSLLIGFTIPLFSAYLKVSASDRLAFQRVYKLYNLGALLGILAVELLLVRRFGVSLSFALVGAVNLFNGFVLLMIKGASEGIQFQKPKSFPTRIKASLALASLSSAVFQMFFLKLSYLVFHPHRENFAVGLSVILLGIFLGAWFASKVAIRFGTLLALFPLVIGLIYVNYLPLLRIYQETASWAQSSDVLIVLHKFAIGCLFALGPMILFGALLPVLMRTEKAVAEESGQLLWISGLANAVGYLLYVLWGHPLLDSDILLVLIVVNLLAAGLLADRFRWSGIEKGLAAAGLVLVALMAIGWEQRNFYLAQWASSLEPRDEVLVFKSGADSATLLRTQRYQWVSYNGHPSIYVERNGLVNLSETISGIIPALSAPDLERALVMGLGTGITAGAVSRIFGTTDVVEINDGFYKMMPFLRHVNLDIDTNPSATLHLADGRPFLIGKEGVYDVIVNSIPAPTYFAASKIYTVEFYDRVIQALKPDGVFSTWLAVRNMSEAGVLTSLATLRHRFRYCDLYLLDDGYYMAMCSNQPMIPRRFSELPVQDELLQQLERRLPGFDPDEFFEDIRVSENPFDYLGSDHLQVNRDDHPILEFFAVRNRQLGKMGSDLFLRQSGSLRPVRHSELEDAARVARRARVFLLLSSSHFNQRFLPVLRGDPEVRAAWLEANEALALSSVREILSALTAYRSGTGSMPDPVGLAELQVAGLLSGRLASGVKDGYRFAFGYESNTLSVAARPDEYRVSGRHSFHADQTGTIRFTPENRPATPGDLPWP